MSRTRTRVGDDLSLSFFWLFSRIPLQSLHLSLLPLLPFPKTLYISHSVFFYNIGKVIIFVFKVIKKTTYENFQYRADSRHNVYNWGCVNNFFEVFCTKIMPSRNKFHAYVQEEVQRPHMARTREPVLDDSGGDPRAKVEDDLEIGGDLLKISQRRNFVEANEDVDVRSRGSNGTHHGSSEAEFGLGSGQQPQRQEARHLSWGRRSGSWEIAPDILSMNTATTQNRGNNH